MMSFTNTISRGLIFGLVAATSVIGLTGSKASAQRPYFGGYYGGSSTTFKPGGYPADRAARFSTTRRPGLSTARVLASSNNPGTMPRRVAATIATPTPETFITPRRAATAAAKHLSFRPGLVPRGRRGDRLQPHHRIDAHPGRGGRQTSGRVFSNRGRLLSKSRDRQRLQPLHASL